MIVNLARPTGNGVTLEPVDGNVMFEGGEPHEGVLATFALNGRDVTGRIVKVSHSIPNDVDSELIVTVEQIDREIEDIGAEEALESLPPGTVEEKKV
jgi:hypothetical protein